MCILIGKKQRFLALWTSSTKYIKELLKKVQLIQNMVFLFSLKKKNSSKGITTRAKLRTIYRPNDKFNLFLFFNAHENLHKAEFLKNLYKELINIEASKKSELTEKSMQANT